ncbi:MAG TPA: class I SAM-dependent methyltransferase [Candidatus Scatavimonas merdigallinarum]|uniref:Class I SAM-dependent methyltransferase n=1 Tax=Candidatus Scatavimonas merdigallinarum TaxID=2840914 RepID=A0A9D0ZIL5_9FIRM|nr:class I SAM-dependent methyltransferase [Candidatus Scatavimonas merdigallinarum]
MTMKQHNSSAFGAWEYDRRITTVIPYYMDMCAQILDLAAAFSFEKPNWLDTGCGTGTLVQMAQERFPDASFTLCDPSQEMLCTTARRLANKGYSFFCIPSQEMDFIEEFDIVTAVFAHHYLSLEQRKQAVSRCCSALKKGGVFISFENVLPNSKAGKTAGLKRWAYFQQQKGRKKEEIRAHLQRMNQQVFPITLKQQTAILQECGFKTVELLWASYMQAGLYAVK